MTSRAPEFGMVLPFGDLASTIVERFARHRRRVRVRFPLATQLARFAVVGGLGTAANALFYLALRLVLETVPANLVALLVSTALSTEINRRFTFGGAHPPQRWRVWVQDLGTVVFYAGYSTAVLLLLHDVVSDATPLQETAAVAVASVVGGALRFLVLKAWVFGRPDGARGVAARDGAGRGNGVGRDDDAAGADRVRADGHPLRAADAGRGTAPRDAGRGGATGARAPRLPAEPGRVGADGAGSGR